MDRIAALDTVIISQQKEWGEILTGFEVKNRYVIRDSGGADLYLAAEQGGSFLGRQFLKNARPFTIHVLEPDGTAVLRVQRPFRFIFHEATVFDASGAVLGTVKRRWSWIRRVFDVLDADGAKVFELFGPILHPWTFQIRVDGQSIGKITKKWSGMLKEAFTKADNFGVTFPRDLDPRAKVILLGAVFLVDFMYFENSGNS